MQYTYMQTLNEDEMFVKKKRKIDNHKLSQKVESEKKGRNKERWKLIIKIM